MTAADESRMPRIVAFAVIMILAALAPVLSARAAEPAKMFHVGIVFVAPCVGSNSLAFEQRLSDLGYVEGKTLAIDLFCLEQIERYPTAMEELVGRKVDVIVTTGQEAALKAAKQATATIPIATLAIDFDPVAKGYAASLARPGGNITGIFLNQTELTGKRLELLKQTVPDMARAIVFWDSNSADQFEGAARAAQILKLPIKSVELRNPPYDYAGALEAANSRPGECAAVSNLPLLQSRPTPPWRARATAPTAVDVRQPATHGCGRIDLLRTQLPCDVSARRRLCRQDPERRGTGRPPDPTSRRHLSWSST
jgi:putative ABC transport system substrate-binding protein